MAQYPPAIACSRKGAFRRGGLEANASAADFCQSLRLEFYATPPKPPICVLSTGLFRSPSENLVIAPQRHVYMYVPFAVETSPSSFAELGCLQTGQLIDEGTRVDIHIGRGRFTQVPFAHQGKGLGVGVLEEGQLNSSIAAPDCYSCVKN
jgi:hypothetical protein